MVGKTIQKSTRTKPVRRWTPEKERVFKGLAGKLEVAGFIVRREELKRGPGWRVMSGSCRAEASKFIFVDSRLSPDDQIAFLSQKVSDIPAEAL